MANSIVSLSNAGSPFKKSSIDQATITYFFTAAVGAGTYVAGGLPISFAGRVTANGNPIQVEIFSYGSPNSGYSYFYNPGVSLSPSSPETQSSGSIQVFTAGAEITGTTPTAVTGDTIRVIARFAR